MKSMRFSQKFTIINFVDNYIKKVNNNLDQIYLSWWSEIISIQQLNKYEN